ncbi:MAG TPA: biotin/lipoyl-containing protein [Candidatus Baltobacteraceae bacterium]|nr:biotin/lipoyl-containing protein [Candidatus Baltobacteraceae bacterium]
MEHDEAARVRALGEIAAEFDLDAIRVRTGDTEIEIVRRDPAVHASPVYGPVLAGPMVAAGAPPPAAAPGGGEIPSPDGGPPPGTAVVTAPIIGVFYRASAPGADPFVEIGSRVEKGETLCILEAMKLMNEIASDYRGVVTRILPENGALVSLGEPLFWIEQ